MHGLGDGRWIVARDNALWLTDGRVTTRLLAGRFERIDARSGVVVNGRAQMLVSAIDAEAGHVTLVLLGADADDVITTSVVEYPLAIPEVQCLYANPASGDVSLFTVDARGVLEQRYVYDGAAQALVDILVRRDVGVPEVKGCAVHDASGHLFLAEGPTGVWRYRASEESDPLREAQLLVAPWGPLDGEVEDIAVDDAGAIWALVADAGQIYRHAPDGAVNAFTLPAAVEATAMAVDRRPDQVALAIFDETEGSAHVADPGLAPGVAAGPLLPAAATVPAAAETDPVSRYGDAADDPAIFVAPIAAQSLILGTDKREGLAVYNLQGQRLQMLPVGRVNNVDLLADVMLGDRRRTVVAASNRSSDTISLFDIEDGRVRHLADAPTSLDDVYGLCMYASSSGVYVFINSTDGRYQQHRVTWSERGPGTELVREFRLPSQPEGCVADPARGRLYMGEEDAGIWESGAEPDGDAPRLVIRTGPALVADVEGMDIYRETVATSGRDRRLLVVSSQGSDSYAIFDLDDDYRLLLSFSIRANLGAGIDGVSETDGLAVTSASLPGSPAGVLVVQDGRNRMPDAPQTFKIVDWRAIAALLSD